MNWDGAPPASLRDVDPLTCHVEPDFGSAIFREAGGPARQTCEPAARCDETIHTKGADSGHPFAYFPGAAGGPRTRQGTGKRAQGATAQSCPEAYPSSTCETGSNSRPATGPEAPRPADPASAAPLQRERRNRTATLPPLWRSNRMPPRRPKEPRHSKQVLSASCESQIRVWGAPWVGKSPGK
jgi:hypothetical protein